MSNTTAAQILFIDSRVADADVLLAGLDPAIEIVRLNATESGLQQMANAVQGRSNISSVHVISHGGPGNLLLGSGVVSQSQLAAEQLALSTLQSALSEDADLLLYGCDVASGAEGQSFINALAAATGADVAASTDLTGGGTAQSDWELESSTGAIETAAIDPVGYQYDLGYWGNVGLTNGDRWNVYRGSQYTIVFDADGGGKGSKYGVANNVGAYNVSNLYTSGYNGDWEAIWYTFTGSYSAVPGSPWYVSNWDPDAGGYTYWGAYANATPWQTSGKSSISIEQGTSQTLFVNDLVNDDYYSANDTWKYFVGGSASGSTNSYFGVGNYIPKYATFTAQTNISLKGQIYLGSMTYSVNDGVNYGNSNSLNPDYYSAYSRYKSATYTTYVYGTYANDAITWTAAPSDQAWTAASRSAFNFGRGAQDPDSIDYVTGYSFIGIELKTGTDTYAASTTTLPTWLKLNGTTFSVENLAPEFAGLEYRIKVRAHSNDGTTIDKTFKLTTGTAAQVNDAPSSVGNSISFNEDVSYTFSDTSFNFTDRDNTVGGSTSTNPAHGSSFVSLKIMSLPNAAAGVLKLNGTVITQAQVDAGLVIAKADIGQLTFESVANYSGSASFSYKVFDGIDQSAASATMNMTVVSVNDRPIITNLSTDATPVAISSINIADTAAYNTSFTPSVGTLTGTLSATDPEATAVTLGIYGGTVSGSTVTKTGLYGDLTLDTTTGAWTYDPNKFAVINKLTGNATETFQFKATDANGYSSGQTLTINITGTNDTPQVGGVLGNETFSSTGNWTYTVPTNAFWDAEGTALTYAATLANGDPLPSWLSFNATTQTFSGDPSTNGTLSLKVSASDGTSSVDQTFDVIVSGQINGAPVVVNPISYQITPSLQETSVVTFASGLVGGTQVTFAGTTVTVDPTRTGAEIAAAVYSQLNADSNATYTAANPSGTASITLTAKANGNLDTSNFVSGTAASAASVTPLTDGVADVKEKFSIDLATILVNPSSPTKNLKLTDWPDAGVISYLAGWGGSATNDVPNFMAFAVSRFNTEAPTKNLGWTASSAGTLLIFEKNTSGPVVNSTYNNGTTAYWKFGAFGAETALDSGLFATTAEGVTGSPETVTLSFSDGTYAGDTLLLASSTVTIPGATGAETAAAVASGTYTGYSDSANTATVTLTAAGYGPAADLTGSSFTASPTATVVSSVSVTQQGGWTYVVPPNTFTDPEGQSLTYTATRQDGSALPAGVTFDATSRTFTGDGTTFNETLRLVATDASGASTALMFGLQVYNGSVTTSLTAGTVPGTSGHVAFADGAGTFSYSVPPSAFAVSGQVPTYSATLTTQTVTGIDDPLPSWLDFNATTQTFSGNPPGGTSNVEVKVTATIGGLTASQTFTLDVANPNDALVVANRVADQSVNASAAVDFSVPANVFTDPENQAVTYSAQAYDGTAWVSLASANSTNLLFDAGTSKITGTPASSLPVVPVRLTGTTADGSTGTTSFTFGFTNVSANSAGSASLAITTDTGTTGASVGDVVTVSVTDSNGFPGSGAQYQWQTSADAGSTWQDVVGSRGTAANTLTLTQEEANAQIRVKTYYTDNQGTPEQLTSGVLNVAVNNVPGSIAILGYPAPGDNLFAQLSDANGLSGGSFVAPTYQWFRSTASNFTGETAISGATGASYTLTPEDGAKYIRVKVSYTDSQGFVTTGLTQAANSGNPMELAPTAPVAVNDVGSAITENSGVNNGTVGAGSGVSTDNLFTNDTDVNVNGRLEFAVEGVYLGSTEGVGTPAAVTGSLNYVSNAPSDTRSYTLEGRYGTIVVAANGNYTYTLNQSNADVQALAIGQSLTESFNYELSDGRPAYLTDTATLTITINGANDAPSLSSASALTSTVNEDIASFINTGILTFVDPDMGATASRTADVNTDFKVFFTAATGRLLVPELPAGATGITVTGSDTGKLTLTGSMAAINDWLSQDRIQYITAPNAVGTATVSVSANDGYGSVSLGSYTLTITSQNDAPLMDLNGLAGQAGGAAGYGLTVSFRPRGDAVLIAETDAAITDADTGDTIQSAVIRLSKGAVDNEFGSIYETLSSSLGSTYTPVVGGTTFTLTGNGTTEITVTGVGTHAQYETIVKSISYINTNPNAYGGNREVTVRLIDTADSPATRLDSNLSMLSLAAVNTSVAVGQKIIINGVDSGASVAQVLDTQNFVASRQILELKTTSAIKFSTSAVLSSVTSGTSLVLEAGNTSVAIGQKLMVGANERATVTAVSTTSGVTTVTINASHAEITAGAQVSFETSAVSTQVVTTAARKVSTDVSSATALQLSAIDLSIEVGQKIYLAGSDTGKTVAAVSHSAAGTLVTASAAMSATTTQELTFRTFATNNLPTAVATIQNVWTTEVDLNGVLDAGRNYTATFTEGQTVGTNIASSSVSLDNQQVFVKEVVVSLTNAVDGASGGNENLLLNSAYTTVLLGRGITYALSENDHKLTLSAIDAARGVTAADMQLALRAVQYENLSQNPSVTPRVINVTVKDVVNSLTGGDEEGISAQTTINIAPSNDAPTLAGDFASTVLEGGAYTLTTSDLSPSDIDNDITTLRYEVASTSSSITVFRDINGDGQVDAGETIAVRNGSTAGQEFTQAEVIAGNIKVKQNGTDVPIIGLTETEAENLVNSAVYTNAAANPSAGLRQVIFQNSTQMSSLGTAGTAVGQPKIALQTGSKTIDGVTYAVVMSGSGASSVATLTVSKAGTGFTEQEAQAIVASLRYGNSASTPTSGDPTVSLSGVVTLNGTTLETQTVVSTVSSVMASATEANAFDASDVTAINAVLATGKNVAQLEFQVTNVAPADSEYLKLLGTQDQVDITGIASDLFSGIDLSTPAAGDSYKTLNFKVTGVSDGVNETITFGSGSTSHVVPLVVGSVVKDGVIYSVTAGSTATERLLTVTKPFAAIGLALRDNGENGVLPVSASMNLTVTPVNDAPTFSATVAGGTFTEGGATRTLFSAAALTDGDTSGAEQDITELKLTITGVRDGSAEKLVVGGQTISLTSGAVVGGSLGYAVTVAGSTATVTLTKTDSASAWATLINEMAYQNTSIAPTNGNRMVTLTSLKDSGGTSNGGADTKALNLASTVTVQGVDTAPVVTSNGATVQSGGLLTITTDMLTATDADTLNPDALVYTLTSSSAQGILFLDKNGNSDVDEGEALVASGEFTQTDLNNGTVKYFHTGNVGADAFSFRVKDATTTLSATPFAITVSAAGGVTGSGTSTANSTDGSETLFQQVAITTNTGESVKTLTFKVSGATDGSAEYLTVNGQDVHLTAGITTVAGVTYTVVDDGSGNFTVSVTSATGFTSTAANAIVNGASYGNDAVPPSSGERAISLATVTTTNGSSTFTTATNIGAVTTISPTVDVFTAAQAQAAIASPGANNDIKALTFTVSGVKDGANEVIKINGQEIALVAGSPVVIEGVTYQVTASTPAGTFIVTMTDATGPGLTEAQAEAIVAGVTLSNSDSTPTDGARSVSLSNYSVGLASGTTISSITSVNGSSIEPLSGAVLTSTTDVDVLTFSVSGVLDGNKEVLVIGGVSVPLVAGTVTNAQGTYVVSLSSGVATVVFTPATPLSNSDAQNLVRAVDYLNTATPVSPGARTVNLVSLSDTATTTPIDQSVTGSVNVAGVVGSTSSISSTTAVNGASVEPLSGAVISSAANIDVLTFSVSGVQDGSDEVLVIGGFSVPLVNGASLSNPNGTYAVTVTDGVATVVFTPSSALTDTAAQALVRGVDYLNNASPLTEGDRTVSLVSLSDVNSTTPIAQSATGSVSVAVVDGVYAPAQPVALSLFDAAEVIAAIPAPASGNDFKSVSFNLTGIADGAQEVFQVNGQDIPLVPGTVTVNGVTYTVTSSTAGSYTVTVTDTAQPGFTEAALQAMVSGATLTNTSSTATEGVRNVTLGTVLQGLSTADTGTTSVTLAGTAPTGSVVAPNTPVNAMAGDSVNVPTGSSVDSLTFTVTGVKDGAAEVLKFGAAPNITSVPLVNGTVTSTDPAGTYAVTVAANGTATVVFTPTVELTPAQANSLIAAATYTNTSNEPTGGVRSLDLTSMDVLNGSTVTATAINNVGGDIAVQGTTEGSPVFDASDVLPTADLAGKTVDSMTFTVTGVKDGANEVLLVNGLAVPLVAGTVTSTSPAGAYVVTVNGSGTATVVFTPTTNLTEAQANALLEGMTYDNKSSDVTGGDRVVSLSSLVTTNPDGTGSATISPTTINGSLPVLEAPPEYAPLFNPTQVNAAIAAPTAGNDYKSISFNLTGIADGANEIFKVNGQNVPLVPGTMTLNGVTYTVTGSGTSYTVTVTDTVFPGFTESDLQTLVNGVVLINTDSTPTEGVRGVTIGTLEQGAAQVSSVTLGGTVPRAAVVTPNTPVNALAGDTVTVASGSTVDSLTFTVTGVADGASEVLKFGVAPNVTSVPLVHGGSITSTDPAGTYAVSVISGTATVVFTPTTNLSAAATNAFIAGATYTNTDTTPTEGVRSLSLTGMAVDNAGTVTQTSVSTVSGQIPVKASTTPLFDSTAVSTAIPAVTSGNDFKSVSFDLTGIKDGAAEVFQVNGQNIPLVAGSVTVAGVNYTVTGTGPDYQVTVTDTIQPGFTEAALQTLVSGATLTNTATSPSEGARGVTLGAVTQGITGTSTVTLASAVNASVLAPDTPVRAMQGDSVVVDDATTSVDSLTFTVTGVKDGAAEVLKFGTTTVPLVSGTVTSTDPAGSFQVTVNETGTATVVFRPTVNLTDAQTDTLIGAASYTNTSAAPTGGVRSLELTSMDVQATSGGAVTATAVTGVGGEMPVQGAIEGESVFNSSAVVPNLTNGKTVDSLTFGVTGVKDGSNEVLVINGVTVPLVNTSAPISDGSGGSYSVVVTNGNAVVVYTPAANLTEAQANALLGGITYDNKASNVTDGARGFSVISMDTVDANNVTTTTATPGLDSVVSYGDVTNTAPVVSVNSGVTVAENQTVTLSASHLAVTDAEQNNLDLVFTLTDAVDRGQLFRDLNGNGLINAGETLAVGNTFTQAELIGGRIKYRHDGSETSSDAFKFTVSDGIDTTAAQPFVINVTSVNDIPAGRPTIDGVIAQNAVLTASLASMSDGDGLPTSAGSFQYVWKADGQTVGANASTYTLTADEIDKKITVSVSYTDLAGFSHTVTSLATAPVVNVNDAPTLTASTLSVFEGGTITLNTSQIVAADQDGLTLGHQFKLMTAPTKGQIYVDANGNGLLDSDDETVVAANGTFTQDDLFSGRVRYQHLGSEEDDSFGLQVIDAGALSSATATFTVTRTAVNDAPTFQNLDGDVIAVPTAGAPVLLDSVANGNLAAVIADVDSANLAGGQLRVAVNFNRNPANDSLAINQVGTGDGQISTSGSDVKFGTITIGTFSGGSGANDLLVTFNANATKAAISALVGAITFNNDELSPAHTERTVAFTLTDGDGGTSDVARVTVNLESNGALIAADGTPPAYVMGTLNGNTLVLYFYDGLSLNAVKKPDPSAFTVTAGNTAVAIAALAVNATAKTVTLTLARALSSVTDLSVAYSDPTAGNDMFALQDIAGNDAASFTVSNFVLMTGSGGSSGGVPHVAPSLESQVSTLAGSSSVAGDGNGDGIADVNQGAVASLPFMVTRMPETQPDNSAMRWVTMVAGAINGKVGANEATRIVQVEQKDAPTSLSGQIAMPMGAIDFELSIPTPGASTTMSTYVDADMSFNGYWIKNSNGIWTNLASAAFGGGMHQEGGKIRIDVNIKDGGEFDSDGLANGVVTETAFVGTIPLTLIGTYSELPDGQTWFGNVS